MFALCSTRPFKNRVFFSNGRSNPEQPNFHPKPLEGVTKDTLHAARARLTSPWWWATSRPWISMTWGFEDAFVSETSRTGKLNYKMVTNFIKFRLIEVAICNHLLFMLAFFTITKTYTCWFVSQKKNQPHTTGLKKIPVVTNQQGSSPTTPTTEVHMETGLHGPMVHAA